MPSQGFTHAEDHYAQDPTTYEDWCRSDKYHDERLIKPDPHLDYVNQIAEENGLPAIGISDAHGKLLNLLARSIKAKKVLEVGTLAGFSAIWLAKALPEDGQVITYELQEKHADVARSNIEKAGLSHKVQVIVGPALENLPKLTDDGTFDIAFIDADKPNNLDYFIHSKRLVRSGGIIIVDNVVRGGKVAIPDIDGDGSCAGVRTLIEYVKDDKDVDCTTIGTVGTKGYDGFMYALRL